MDGQLTPRSPLAHIREYSDSTNPFLQKAALLYASTTDTITLEKATSASGPTAYLSAFISLLASFTSSQHPDKVSIGSVCYLISQLLPHVSTSVLVHLLPRLSSLFIVVLKTWADIGFIAKNALYAVSALLRLLPPLVLRRNDSCKPLIQALLVFSVDPRPKIRKHAQRVTARVYTSLPTIETKYIVPAQFEEVLLHFASLELDSSTEISKKDVTSVLHFCGLLKMTLHTLSTHGIATIVSQLIQLTVHGNQYLLLQTFYVLSNLFKRGFEMSTCLCYLQRSTASANTLSQTPTQALWLKQFSTQLSIPATEQAQKLQQDASFILHLFLTVLDLKPNGKDVVANNAFNSVIVAMFRTLYQFQQPKAYEQLSAVMHTLYESCRDAQHHDVFISSLHALRHIIAIAMSQEHLEKGLANPNVTFVLGQKDVTFTPANIIAYIQQLFTLPSLREDSLVLLYDLIIASMTHAKPQHYVYFQNLLIIVDTYHSKAAGNDFVQTACEKTLGHAIQRFGPEQVLASIPINFPTFPSTSDSSIPSVAKQLASSRVWLLQLLSNNIRHARLEFFAQHLLPAASTCYELSLLASKSKRSEEATILKDIVEFIWDTLPAFCLLPIDTVTQVKPLVKELLQYYSSEQFGSISQRPILRALRNLAAKNVAIVNDRWGKVDDLGLQCELLDNTDLVLLHTEQDRQQFEKMQQLKRAGVEDVVAALQDADAADEAADDADESNGTVDDDDDNVVDEKGNEATLQSVLVKRAQEKQLVSSHFAIMQIKQSLFENVTNLQAPISKTEAEANIKAIGGLVKNILPLLFNTQIELWSNDLVHIEGNAALLPLLSDTILALSCVAPQKTLMALFSTAFENYVKLSQEITQIYQRLDRLADGESDSEDEEEHIDEKNLSSRQRAQRRAQQRSTSLLQLNQPVRKCRALLDIFLSLSPKLNTECIELLFKSILVTFNSPNDQLQKKSYGLANNLLMLNQNIFDAHWKSCLAAISVSSSNIQPSAHKARLLLCRTIYTHVKNPLSHQEIVPTLPSLLSEFILATKESSIKVRTASFELIVAIGINIYNSGINQESTEENQVAGSNAAGRALLTQYITMVLAGLAASTPRLLSATISVLSRLIFEFKSVLDTSIVRDMFSTVLILLPSKSREILKALLAFIKVCIVALPITAFQSYIHEMLYTMGDWRDSEKSRFKRPVRVLYQLLLKKLDFDFLRDATPPDDKRLVDYLRKQQQRHEKQRQQQRLAEKSSNQMIDDTLGQGSTFGGYIANKGKVDNDGDDDNADDNDLEQFHSGMSFDQIVNLGEDDPTGYSAADLLERSVGLSSSKKNVSLLDADSLVTLDDNTDFLDPGLATKLRQKLNKKNTSSAAIAPEDIDDDDVVSGKKRRAAGIVDRDGKIDFTSLEKDIVAEERAAKQAKRVPTEKEREAERQQHRDQLKERRQARLEEHQEKLAAKLGSEFASQRAKGDIKRSGQKFDPYAYVPLDPRTLNTKKLNLYQQSQRFASVFDRNTGHTAGKKGPGQKLNRAQRFALRKKGGKFKNNV